MVGRTLAISATLPATYDESGYAATTITYTAIGELESIGAFGLVKDVLEFTPVGTGVVTKLAGKINYGSIAVVGAQMFADAGQDIVRTAAGSTARYSLKLTNPDTSVVYLDVLVVKDEDQGGDVGAIHKVSYEFAICRAPVMVAQA
jgi:hypothetical protein